MFHVMAPFFLKKLDRCGKLLYYKYWYASRKSFQTFIWMYFATTFRKKISLNICNDCWYAKLMYWSFWNRNYFYDNTIRQQLHDLFVILFYRRYWLFMKRIQTFVDRLLWPVKGKRFEERKKKIKCKKCIIFEYVLKLYFVNPSCGYL